MQVKIQKYCNGYSFTFVVGMDQESSSNKCYNYYEGPTKFHDLCFNARFLLIVTVLNDEIKPWILQIKCVKSRRQRNPPEIPLQLPSLHSNRLMMWLDQDFQNSYFEDKRQRGKRRKATVGYFLLFYFGTFVINQKSRSHRSYFLLSPSCQLLQKWIHKGTA